MFKDNSLIPTEAVRLAALGLLTEAPRRYGDLAMEIRHFLGLAVGPSLDLMGSSLEMLRYEGLVAASDGTGMSDNAMLALTDAGRSALSLLLQATLRAPSNDASRLALLLKLRFFHHLPPAAQEGQRRQIVASLQIERERLEELRRLHPAAPAAFRQWLDDEIAVWSLRLERLSA